MLISMQNKKSIFLSKKTFQRCADTLKETGDDKYLKISGAF